MGTSQARSWLRAAAPLIMPSTERNEKRPKKLLVKVTVERSLGPMHVLVSPEQTVADLIKTAVEMYVKEGRRPLLCETDPKEFELHYSQFSLESKLFLHMLVFLVFSF